MARVKGERRKRKEAEREGRKMRKQMRQQMKYNRGSSKTGGLGYDWLLLEKGISPQVEVLTGWGMFFGGPEGVLGVGLGRRKSNRFVASIKFARAGQALMFFSVEQRLLGLKLVCDLFSSFRMSRQNVLYAGKKFRKCVTVSFT